MFDLTINNIITFVHGDDVFIKLFINTGTKLAPVRYELTQDDEVFLAVMEPEQNFETAIIRKIFTYKDLDEDKDLLIHFESKDTINLIPGKYYYEIKIKLKDKETNEYLINTIIPKTQFNLL